jgi:hypothetical protein
MAKIMLIKLNTSDIVKISGHILLLPAEALHAKGNSRRQNKYPATPQTATGTPRKME